jgi:hypothetical protein
MPWHLNENRPVIMSVDVMLAAVPQQFPPLVQQPPHDLRAIRLD